MPIYITASGNRLKNNRLAVSKQGGFIFKVSVYKVKSRFKDNLRMCGKCVITLCLINLQPILCISNEPHKTVMPIL